MLFCSWDLGCKTHNVTNEATVRQAAFEAGGRCELLQEDLDFRRRCLEAASTHHLCKSLVMVNTRVPDGQPEAAADGGPQLPKYIAVLVQVRFVSSLVADLRL